MGAGGGASLERDGEKASDPVVFIRTPALGADQSMFNVTDNATYNYGNDSNFRYIHLHVK